MALLSMPAALAQAPAPGLLDAHDCDVIESYDARWFVPSILEQFGQMALSGEWCLNVGGPCAAPYLARWDDPFALTVKLGTGVEATSEEAAAAMNGLDAAMSLVVDARGVGTEDVARLGPPAVPGSPQVRVAIAPRDEMRAIAREWSAVVPGLDLEGHAEIGASLEPSCWAVAADVVPTPGRLVAGFDFLDSDLPPETLLLCGKEEGLNLFIPSDPIGDASLFDDPWGRRPPDPVLGQQFSARDETLLRLLYFERLRAGQPADEARAAAAAIRDGCGGDR